MDACVYRSLSLFNTIEDSCTGNGATQGGKSPHLSEPSQDNALQAYPDAHSPTLRLTHFLLFSFLTQSPFFQSFQKFITRLSRYRSPVKSIDYSYSPHQHSSSQSLNSGSRVSDKFWSPRVPGTNLMHRHACRLNIHTHKTKYLFKLQSVCSVLGYFILLKIFFSHMIYPIYSFPSQFHLDLLPVSLEKNKPLRDNKILSGSGGSHL